MKFNVLYVHLDDSSQELETFDNLEQAREHFDYIINNFTDDMSYVQIEVLKDA